MRRLPVGATHKQADNFLIHAFPLLTMQILIADDFELMRDGIRSLILRQGWEVCGTAVSGREAVEKVEQLRPDVAIIDITMPVLDGIEATRQIRSGKSETEVLILTAHEDDQPIRDAMDAGAKGYLFKSEAATGLIEGIKTVAQHKVFLSDRVSEVMMGSIREGRWNSTTSPLSRRERQIIKLIAEGKSNKEMGEALKISSRTAEAHRYNLMRKLSVDSVAALIRYAVRNHIIEP